MTQGGHVPEGFEKLLTAEDVSEIFNVDKSWVYHAARNGTLPSVRVGRWVRFQSAAVQDFVSQGGTDK